jgi:acetylglutamate/LysW-gamma-L-alpha-aminoadipate kinase
LTPPGASTAGEAINVDGDRAAAMVAGALKAEALVILSDVAGLLRVFPDETTLITEIPRSHADRFMQYAEGRMKKKVMGAVEAIGAGVGKVIFADGRIAEPITRALAGGGTHIGDGGRSVGPAA